MADIGHQSPSEIQIHIGSSQIKKPSFPIGNKDRKDNFCGTTLLAEKSGHLRNGANTPSALNAGNTSSDTRDRSLSPCPLRPICCPALRSVLSFRNSLWMR